MTSLAVSLTPSFVFIPFGTEEYNEVKAQWKEEVKSAIRDLDPQDREAVVARTKSVASSFERIPMNDLLDLLTGGERVSPHINQRTYQLLHSFYSTMQENCLRSLRRSDWKLRYYEVKDSSASSNRVYLVGEEALEKIRQLEQWKRNFLQGAKRLLSRCSRICVEVTTNNSTKHPLLELAHEVVVWGKKGDIKERYESAFRACGLPDANVIECLQKRGEDACFFEILIMKIVAEQMNMFVSRVLGEQKEIRVLQESKRLLLDERIELVLAEIHKLFSAGAQGDSMVLLDPVLIESNGGLADALAQSGYVVAEYPLS